jgi:hypothetical protein
MADHVLWLSGFALGVGAWLLAVRALWKAARGFLDWTLQHRAGARLLQDEQVERELRERQRREDERRRYWERRLAA